MTRATVADGGVLTAKIGRPMKGGDVASLPYELDAGAQRIVAENPDGDTPYTVIGAHLGIGHERVRQIEVEAVKKLGKAMLAAGIDAADFAGMLAARHGERHEPDHVGFGDQRAHARERREALAWERIGTGAQSPVVLALCEGLDSIRETAVAHRFVERVVCGMEDGGEMRVLEERLAQEVFSSRSDVDPIPSPDRPVAPPSRHT